MIGNKRTSYFEGLFIYKIDGKFVLLDTKRSVRIASEDYQTEAEIAWNDYIINGRSSPNETPYTEKDKESLKRNITLRY